MGKKKQEVVSIEEVATKKSSPQEGIESDIVFEIKHELEELADSMFRRNTTETFEEANANNPFIDVEENKLLDVVAMTKGERKIFINLLKRIETESELEVINDCLAFIKGKESNLTNDHRIQINLMLTNLLKGLKSVSDEDGSVSKDAMSLFETVALTTLRSLVLTEETTFLLSNLKNQLNELYPVESVDTFIESLRLNLPVNNHSVRPLRIYQLSTMRSERLGPVAMIRHHGIKFPC